MLNVSSTPAWLPSPWMELPLSRKHTPSAPPMGSRDQSHEGFTCVRWLSGNGVSTAMECLYPERKAIALLHFEEVCVCACAQSQGQRCGISWLTLLLFKQCYENRIRLLSRFHFNSPIITWIEPKPESTRMDNDFSSNRFRPFRKILKTWWWLLVPRDLRFIIRHAS